MHIIKRLKTTFTVTETVNWLSHTVYTLSNGYRFHKGNVGYHHLNVKLM